MSGFCQKLERYQADFEAFYNGIYIDLCLGTIEEPNTEQMRISADDNTALKVIKIGITFFSLGLIPFLYFGTLKGIKIIYHWLSNEEDCISRLKKIFLPCRYVRVMNSEKAG